MPQSLSLHLEESSGTSRPGRCAQSHDAGTGRRQRWREVGGSWPRSCSCLSFLLALPQQTSEGGLSQRGVQGVPMSGHTGDNRSSWRRGRVRPFLLSQNRRPRGGEASTDEQTARPCVWPQVHRAERPWADSAPNASPPGGQLRRSHVGHPLVTPIQGPGIPCPAGWRDWLSRGRMASPCPQPGSTCWLQACGPAPGLPVIMAPKGTERWSPWVADPPPQLLPHASPSPSSRLLAGSQVDSTRPGVASHSGLWPLGSGLLLACTWVTQIQSGSCSKGKEGGQRAGQAQVLSTRSGTR